MNEETINEPVQVTEDEIATKEEKKPEESEEEKKLREAAELLFASQEKYDNETYAMIDELIKKRGYRGFVYNTTARLQR